MMYDVTPIDAIEDWSRRLDRQDAFWRCEILDRPLVMIQGWQERVKVPVKRHETHRERWFDAEWLAERSAAQIRNTNYYGDALPQIMPNLGPEAFNAFLGMELEFGESTSWSIPNLQNWHDIDKIAFSQDNPYWKKMCELTDALLSVGKNLFYVGLTDFHPGGDACAAFRDPLQFNIDMIEAHDEVKLLMRKVTDIYFKVFELSRQRLSDAGQACGTWLGPLSRLTWYVPSNDFSCMISKEMFDDYFLPGIAEECRALQASIYHLDGPGALHHLDSLLSIPELNAIQWVYGAGHGKATDWLHVYKKIQAAGKGIHLTVGPDELDTVMAELSPAGAWMHVAGNFDQTEADAIIKRVSAWTK
ncbi:MAG: hypothetical protein GX230_04765 [Lentisphaerae bacterium]|nr:hypothetical protein [Lentisphaerota bacterium]